MPLQLRRFEQSLQKDEENCEKGTGKIGMWYVIQTLGGEEEKTIKIIRKLVSTDILEECFIPKRERLKKFHGCWNKTEEILFRGYVFVDSEKPEELYECLRQVPRFTKLLGREGNWFETLDEKEERLVREIGDTEHRTSLSKIIVGEGKKIYVTDGPLKNYAKDVVKVNLHKREAIMRIKFMGRLMELKMGIEIEDKPLAPYVKGK